MKQNELLEKFITAFKKCKNSCVVQDINNHIRDCSYESDNEDGELVGFDMLALDPHCQGWLDAVIGSAIIWVNADDEIVRIGAEA